MLKQKICCDYCTGEIRDENKYISISTSVDSCIAIEVSPVERKVFVDRIDFCSFECMVNCVKNITFANTASS